MKTTKMRLIATMITLAAVVTGLNVEAQRQDTRTRRESPKNERNYQVEPKQGGREYRKPDHNFKSNKSKHWKNNRDYRAQRNYKIDRDNRHWDRDDHRRYSNRDWDNHYRYNRRYEYHHPQYGHVYRRFHTSPIRLRYANGDIFFAAGNYYRYYRGVGYVRIAVPRNVVFYNLPFQCERVRVGPQVYYRYGNLVFERYNHGFRLAPSIGIHLSAHF